jgi:hypothetical protein
MWRTAAIAMVLSLLSGVAQGQGRLMAKSQPMDCAFWRKEGHSDPMRVTGIVFARTNFSQNGLADLLKGKSDREIGRFLDDYCKANPGENFSRAIEALREKLKTGSTTSGQ